MRLEPATLGEVEVRIVRPPDGPAGVQITASQSDTLLLLVRDQPALQQALDRAGLVVDPRAVSFHLAPPPPTAPLAASQGPAVQSGFASLTGGATTRDDAPRRRRSGLAVAAAPSEATTSLGTPGVRWLRAGLDITA